MEQEGSVRAREIVVGWYQLSIQFTLHSYQEAAASSVNNQGPTWAYVHLDVHMNQHCSLLRMWEHVNLICAPEDSGQ